MDNKPKNREWVKTAAIIFLTVLLILTFFSNTINNRLLPEVSTTAVTDGTITASVRASGKVEAAANNEVKATGTRTVAAVKVKAGQEVSTGDVLFVMGSAASEELEAAEDARDSAYYSYRRAQVSYPIDTTAAGYYTMLAAAQAYERALAEYDRAINELSNAGVNDSDVLIAQNKIDQAQAQLQFATQNAEIKRNQALAEFQTAQGTLEAFLPSYDPSDPASQAQYDLLLTDVNTKQNSYLVLLNTSAEEEAAMNALSEAEYAYSSLMRRYDVAYSAYQKAESAVFTAESAYNSAMASYNSAVATQGQQAAQAGVNVEEAEHAYNRKQDRLKALSGEGEDANVYAAVNGIIESINVSAGNTVTKGDVLCTIEVPDMGYVMSATVTADQAKRLKVGDTAQASNFYWGKTVNAEITSIKPDPKDPQGKRIVTFDVSGDVTNKQELTLNVGTRSASYDIIVPKSAVMSDNNGSFVLIIESKSSPLGNRYFARRVPVEVIAEDDSFRAVSGSLGNGDFVITNSSTKINSGDQVRLADAA
ncbi:MAG: HlyD family efflux transporter periplasmic adaptor subunit [Oscillospiraceae bacterium]|nr:HlyD family efflux transporter periplasmic adaptor subunit [Oscillospiraceae bacterium]